MVLKNSAEMFAYKGKKKPREPLSPKTKKSIILISSISVVVLAGSLVAYNLIFNQEPAETPLTKEEKINNLSHESVDAAFSGDASGVVEGVNSLLDQTTDRATRVQLLFTKASALANSRDFQGAIQIFTNSLEYIDNDSDRFVAYTNIADCYMLMEDVPNQTIYLEKALELNHSDVPEDSLDFYKFRLEVIKNE